MEGNELIWLADELTELDRVAGWRAEKIGLGFQQKQFDVLERAEKQQAARSCRIISTLLYGKYARLCGMELNIAAARGERVSTRPP